MLPLPLPLDYALVLIGWSALLGFAVRWLLICRRRRRREQRSCRGVHIALMLCLLLAFVTTAEAGFALYADHSDAFNMTNVSRRWFDLHIEAERNEFGARDRLPFPADPREGRHRICFVGDSFTIGHGIDRMEDRFSDRTFAALERACPGRYAVANLGDPGLEVSQIEARVAGILQNGYHVDTVVYVICPNDIEGYDPQTQRTIRELQQWEPRMFLLRRTFLLNWLYFRWVQATQPGAGAYFPHLARSYQERPWQGMQASLEALQSNCRNHGAELRIAIFPFLTELADSSPFISAHRRIRDWCEAHEVPVVDLRPVLAAHADEDLTVNAYDAHPNEKAHAIAAEAIMGSLLSDLADCREE